MSATLEQLLAAKREADAALAEAEATLLAELVAAKDAYREDPSEATRARKAEAVAEVQAWRAIAREGRATTQVGGDAFRSPEQIEG